MNWNQRFKKKKGWKLHWRFSLKVRSQQNWSYLTHNIWILEDPSQWPGITIWVWEAQKYTTRQHWLGPMVGSSAFFWHFFAILQRERAPQHHQRLLEKIQIKFQKKAMKSPKKLADFDKILAFFLKNCHIKIVGSSK